MPSVIGDIRLKWLALGGPGSFLGQPLTDELGTPDGVGRFNRFERGMIYWTPQLGAHEVHGAILDKWSAMGFERSYLGYPTSDEMNSPDGRGRISLFQGGAITWTEATGAVVSSLEFDFSPIVFGGGVPVGGWSHLTLRQDASYTFSGHYHDSGGTEYNVSVVWAVKDSANQAYTFQHAGHVSGTFESGSRDDDWRIDSRDDRLANHWAALTAGPVYSGKAEAKIDLVNLTNSAIGTLGTVLGIVAIVAA